MSDTVLVVDDDRAILDSVVDVLRAEGYRVLSAGNGLEALKVLHDERPCVILLDMRMPQMDGWGFAAELNARGVKIPIMVMTAAQNAAKWCAEIGAQAVLAKPFGIDALLDGVQRLCRGCLP